MNILFDLLHTSDINLFKNIITKLDKKHYNIFIILRERGILEKIARHEFPNYTITRIGKHRKNFYGKIFFAIEREFKAYVYLKKNKIDLVVCQGIACGIACKILNIKIIHFDDDSEYKLTFYMGKFFSDIDIMPCFMPVTGSNIVKYKGYKELAYLHPDYFHPNVKSLEQYDLKTYGYIFIREISNISLNYHQRKNDFEGILGYITKKNIKILLSLEDKKLIGRYQSSCILLKEPILDLYSLIYFSKFAISSGDTMAREACLLGVPCIYTGGREMAANDQFLKLGIMHQLNGRDKINLKIDQLLTYNNPVYEKKRMYSLITKQFDDINKIALKYINKLIS